MFLNPNNEINLNHHELHGQTFYAFCTRHTKTAIKYFASLNIIIKKKS